MNPIERFWEFLKSKIDSQSVKSAAMVSQGMGSRAGKKIKGRKRFISVDTMVLAATRRLVSHKHQTPNLDGDFEKNFGSSVPVMPNY